MSESGPESLTRREVLVKLRNLFAVSATLVLGGSAVASCQTDHPEVGEGAVARHELGQERRITEIRLGMQTKIHNYRTERVLDDSTTGLLDRITGSLLESNLSVAKLDKCLREMAENKPTTELASELNGLMEKLR